MIESLLSGNEPFRKSFKIFKRSKSVPLRRINYKDEFYFEKFVENSLHKWKEIESNQTRLKKLILYQRDLLFIYIDIALIASRINEDGAKINRSEELWEIIHQEERQLTESEADELDNLRIFINYLVLDVKSLFINILIFMDKLARFLSLLIETERLRSKSFDKFKRDLEKLRGKEIEELSRLVNRHTEWFKKIKDIRDDFIEHHPGASGMMGFGDGKAHATLVTTKGGDKIFKDISIEEIGDVLSQLKKLLKGLDEYFRRIGVLPIKSER